MIRNEKDKMESRESKNKIYTFLELLIIDGIKLVYMVFSYYTGSLLLLLILLVKII